MNDWGEIVIDWNDTDTYDSGKDEDGNLSLEDKLFKKFAEKNTQTIKKVEEIGLPVKGEQTRLITMNCFNTISIVDYISRQEKITEAIFVIFAINQSAARLLIEMKKAGRINNIKFIISSIRNAGHKSKSLAVDMLKKHFDDLIYVNSHAKISILKTENENYYVIEGSGNFSFNGRIEQYIIDNDKLLYDFSKKWIKEIEQYKMK
jgi:aspartate aminotransferase-like enzyme